LALAGTLHWQHASREGRPLFEGVTPRIVAHYFGLAACYTVNGQLTFYCMILADPGTFTLGKSVAPYLVAILLRLTGQHLQQLQWVCIVLMCTSLATTQYDGCHARGVLPASAYFLIAFATCITAVSSVWNQKVVKGFTVPVNLQNAILYTFGFLLAMASYAYGPIAVGDKAPPPTSTLGFFSGYSPLVIILVLFNAFNGLAVTLVYKYADAIVKNFASSAVMAIVVILSVYFFNASSTVHTWLGVVGVLTTTYCYMNIAIK